MNDIAVLDHRFLLQGGVRQVNTSGYGRFQGPLSCPIWWDRSNASGYYLS